MNIKIIVGVALAVFVLIVGNILAFGLLGKENTTQVNNSNLNYVPEKSKITDNDDDYEDDDDYVITQPTKPVVNNTPVTPPKTNPPPVTSAS